MELLLHPGPVLGAGRMLNHGDHTAAPRGWQALSLASEPPCNRTLQALWHQGVAAPEIRRAWTPPTVISTPKKKTILSRPNRIWWGMPSPRLHLVLELLVCSPTISFYFLNFLNMYLLLSIKE